MPFALATVVRREPPTSARPGRKALVEADDTFRGWLGGSCIEPVVRREAISALRRRRPRLLIFSPDAAESPATEPAGRASSPGGASPAGRDSRFSSSQGSRSAEEEPDVARHPMTCHSGGTVEIFVEPQLPSPVLALFGDSPVNRALSAMGAVVGYAVRVVEAPGDTGDPEPGGAPAEATKRGGAPAEATEPGDVQSAPELYAVVATMGDWDEDAVQQALTMEARYVGLVASPRRAEEIRRTLRDRGLEEASLEPLSSPAGLDLGAREPAEIAITILAELIAVRRGRSHRTAPVTEDISAEMSTPATHRARPDGSAAEGSTPSSAPATATDPVCGMMVEVDAARHTLQHEGTTYFFCCGGCKSRFAADPQAYLDLAG